MAKRENNFFSYLSFINQRFSNNSKVIKNAIDIWLARKGILLEAQKRIQDVLVGDDNSKAREIFADLARVRQQLARLVLGGPGKEGSQAYQKRNTALTNKKETLEGQLSQMPRPIAKIIVVVVIQTGGCLHRLSLAGYLPLMLKTG